MSFLTCLLLPLHTKARLDEIMWSNSKTNFTTWGYGTAVTSAGFLALPLGLRYNLTENSVYQMIVLGRNLLVGDRSTRH